MHDDQRKQTVLRMIPYGLHVLTAEGRGGAVAASAVSWLMQTSFQPTLIVAAIQPDSGLHAMVRESRKFAVNFLRKGQQEVARTFFQHLDRNGDTIGGRQLEWGREGVPILAEARGWLEARVVDVNERGDHTLFIAEVPQAGLREEPSGRPDVTGLLLQDLGEKVFYGGYPKWVSAA